MFEVLFFSIDEKSSSDKIGEKGAAEPLKLSELCPVEEKIFLFMRFTLEIPTACCFSALEEITEIEDVVLLFEPRVDFLALKLRSLMVLNEPVADAIDISVDPNVVALAFCIFSCPRSDNSNLSPSLTTQSEIANQFNHRNKLMFIVHRNRIEYL